MPSITAAAFDLVPSTTGAPSARARWETLLVVAALLLELVEVHEPPLVVVVLPAVVARLPARWANSTLDSSITVKSETISFFTAPPFDLQRSPGCVRAVESRLH